MTTIVKDGRIITIARDFVACVTDDFKGYRVQLHAVPQWDFRVEADTMDHAVRIAHESFQKDTGRKISNAATARRL